MKRLLFAVSLFFLSTISQAAERILLKSVAKGEVSLATKKLDDFLNISQSSSDYSFTTLNNISTDFAKNYIRIQQTYKGLKIWGEHIVSTRNLFGLVENVQGYIYKNLEFDIPLIVPKFSKTYAINLLKNKISDSKILKYKYENEKAELQIYLDNKQKARLIYVVDFFMDSYEQNFPSRPMALIDAISGDIINQWDALTFAEATGPGGNLKTGKYHYGTDYGYLNVVQKDKICFMENDNVQTLNLNNTKTEGIVHSFVCPESTIKEVNGAYSPINDAHYIGNIVYNMYKNWYNITPLQTKLELRVHYGKNYENAFWNGFSVSFGDGDVKFYPLVSVDVISHEIAHAFTEYNSGLMYVGQAAAINESFSDMAGEAAEYYMKAKNDFYIGADIFKNDNEALRYMDNPTRDGVSVDHIKNYVEGMNVHYAAGVYNKAFYLLATTSGWNTRKAFDVFLYANTAYWKPNTDFNSGVCGVLKATRDLNYNETDVVSAFEQVGAVCNDGFGFENQAPIVDFNYTPDSTNPLKLQLNDTSTDDGKIISWFWTMSDNKTYNVKNPVHTFINYGINKIKLTVTDNNGASTTLEKDIIITKPIGIELLNGVIIPDIYDNTASQNLYNITIPAGTKNLRFIMKGNIGDADLYIKYGAIATTSSWDYRPYNKTSDEIVFISKPKEGVYYAMIRGSKPFASVSLKAIYE